MRKAKRILAFALSLVVAFSGINYVASTSNEAVAATVSTTEWTNNGLISPANGSLIGPTGAAGFTTGVPFTINVT